MKRKNIFVVDMLL